MLDRSTPLRGFTCAVSRDDARPGAARIDCALDDQGGDCRFVLQLRHADGTALVALLTEDGLARLADLLVLLVAAASPDDQAPAGATIQ